MTLTDHRKARGLNIGSAAREIGCSQGHLSDIETGKERPSPTLAMRIERWSDGAISAADLHPLIAELRDEAAA